MEPTAGTEEGTTTLNPLACTLLAQWVWFGAATPAFLSLVVKRSGFDIGIPAVLVEGVALPLPGTLSGDTFTQLVLGGWFPEGPDATPKGVGLVCGVKKANSLGLKLKGAAGLASLLGETEVEFPAACSNVL